ncbi:MAG: NAD(P)H-hydrate dehydratase [Acidobacteriota bacterium]
MIPILDSREMRAADRAAIRSGIPATMLMENAARGIVDAIAGHFPAWRRIVVVCGPGNNGGDGLAAARLLARRGHSIRVFTLRDFDAYSGAAAINAERARGVGLALESLAKERGGGAFSKAAAEADGVVDALFGTGLDRPLTGLAARAVSAINAAGRPVVAADIPSGLFSDSAAVREASVHAAVTVAFAAPKICHAFPPARSRCGTLVVHDIGIPKRILARKSHRLFLATANAVRELLPARDTAGHKGDFGRVAIVAGSRGKAGAAVLAARGALRGGAGSVTVFAPASVGEAVVSDLPEAMTEALPEEAGSLAAKAGRELVARLEAFDVAVIGPGLGTSEGTVAAIHDVIAGLANPVVLDADGLNAFAGGLRRLARRPGPTLLTPHPGEAARLLRSSSRTVQADRLTAARTLARRARCGVLLKGEATLFSSPDGRVVVNPTGSPLLATAGSGDVLAGLIGALVASGLGIPDAAAAATWLHGAAGDTLALRLGDAGLLAHEVADAVPVVRHALRASRET